LVKTITILFLVIISYLTLSKKINLRVGIFLIAGSLGNFIDRLRL
jgi:lipoprotein signal peptidase